LTLGSAGETNFEKLPAKPHTPLSYDTWREGTTAIHDAEKLNPLFHMSLVDPIICYPSVTFIEVIMFTDRIAGDRMQSTQYCIVIYFIYLMFT
jgi:hypothetical protein